MSELEATLTEAIRSIYDRHDRNAPLNHVNVAEWTAVLAPVIAEQVAAGAAKALEEYIDEGGLPKHLPMGVTQAGEGPTEPDSPHHRVCWCVDPRCCWTLALAAERAGI